MIISAEVRVPFPRPQVYATYRDKVVELLPYLPNVRRIDIKSRREEDGLIHFVNEWHGGGEIPVVARAIITEAMLAWTDFATWNEFEFMTQWQIKTHAFTEAVRCAGVHRFKAADDGTVIETRGELVIDAKQIKGVPSLLAGTVGRTVEDFISQQIEPNLLEVGEGVRQFLERSQKR